MNYISLIFLGTFAALASSFWGLILAPHLEIGQLGQTRIEETGLYYPVARSGSAEQGAQVYRTSGCAECHSQQVRSSVRGPDFQRGWGRRRTVAEDYLLDSPVQLGVSRFGPDLMNVGLRLPDPNIHLQHLYHPKITAPSSVMPQYRFLFNEHKLVGTEKPPANALPPSTKPGFAVTPKPEALALVHYLISLGVDKTPLYSAPFPLVKTNAVAPVARPEK